jgi:putative transcriptional regulator
MMEEKLFNELVDSVKEMGGYLRGEIDLPASRIHFVGEPDPREIRARLGMTQEEFAAALCISVKTLRNWEQGRRDPSGPAMRLLQIADKHPEILIESAVENSAPAAAANP